MVMQPAEFREVDYPCGHGSERTFPRSTGRLGKAGAARLPRRIDPPARHREGDWTRPAAIVVAINMLTAILLVHIGEIFSLNKGGGWAIELQGMFLIAAVSVALLGAGGLSVGGRYGRWN